MAKEPKQPQLEKRYRALIPLRHALFECVVEPGEDIDMTAPRPDGTPYRYADKIQERLNDRHIELYFAPIGSPHVVHSRGIREYQDSDTGEWKREPQWTDAAKQWVGETEFIEAYVETKALAPVEPPKLAPYATPVMPEYQDTDEDYEPNDYGEKG